MIPVKRNMNPEEQKNFRKERYVLQRDGLIALYKEKGIALDMLGTALVNLMRSTEVAEWAKEDGYSINEDEVWYDFIGEIAVPKESAPEDVKESFCSDFGMTTDELPEFRKEGLEYMQKG